MNETYVEWLVKKKTPLWLRFLKYLLITMTVLVCLLGFLTYNIIIFIIGVALGIGAYFSYLQADVEYEYLYVDRELTVDKVLAKSKRKRVASFDLGRMEVVAPLKSYHLDEFSKRSYKAVDYSSREEKQPEARYVFYYDGQQKVSFEPNEEMIKAMQFVAPRKVFTN